MRRVRGRGQLGGGGRLRACGATAIGGGETRTAGGGSACKGTRSALDGRADDEKLPWLVAGVLSVEAVESVDALRTVRASRLPRAQACWPSVMLSSPMRVAGEVGVVAPPDLPLARKAVRPSRLIWKAGGISCGPGGAAKS